MNVSRRITHWTRDSILEMLTTNDKWVERALVALYHRQTELEQATDTTYIYNVRGFQVADSQEFSRYARKILAGNHLSAEEMARCRRPWHRGFRVVPTIAKYRRQILEMIEEAARLGGERPL